MKLNVVFLHPDLGIGGAERLVVDAALAMKNTGHDVQFITNHHSPSHCFEETKNGIFSVTVVGDWLPRTLLGKCYALCSYLRMIYAALYLTFFSGIQPDVVFVDQVSVCVPILHWIPCKVIFYCHYPDQLLTSHDNIIKRFYRLPLDWLEEQTTACADVILVNSYFTLNVFKKTFKSVKKTPQVLYPSINTTFFDNCETIDISDIVELDKYQIVLSINRFERKKNLELALKCMSHCSFRKNVKLVLAGGYDPLNLENKEYYEVLKKLVQDLDLVDSVVFLKSPSDKLKISLLRYCTCLVYTPSNEHFGIVPLEAMYCSKPVIAVNSGGPTETIKNNHNGFLCDANPEEFTEVIKQLVDEREKAEQFGKRGKKRFDDMFSFQAFECKVNGVLESLYKPQ